MQAWLGWVIFPHYLLVGFKREELQLVTSKEGIRFKTSNIYLEIKKCELGYAFAASIIENLV